MGCGHRLVASIAAGLLALVPFSGVVHASTPDESGIVIRFDDWFAGGFRDADDDLVALAGPPAEQWCNDVGFEDYVTQFQFVNSPSGALVLQVEGTDLPVWVYRGSTFAEICDAVLAGGSPELLAWGAARFTAVDNDLFASGTRTNTFGTSASGRLADEEGRQYSFSAILRLQNQPSEGGGCRCRILHEDITLAARG